MEFEEAGGALSQNYQKKTHFSRKERARNGAPRNNWGTRAQ
jgi:hypothetical protein